VSFLKPFLAFLLTKSAAVAFAHATKVRENQDKIRKCFKQKFYHVLKDTKGKVPYDALIAYSGGKDSIYTLRLLKETFGLRILAITFESMKEKLLFSTLQR
jgi:3'-phosphoadenosine 5'-phosphosulfate sulfotransferase (PAPS reductase)/FAD synthetase